MTGRGSRMSPKERYLRSVYLNYQVCTDVVRHYFDGLHPPTSLVQYLLDQRTKFEKEEKKIPNYQWIQLYPEVLFRADVHIKEIYLASYDRTDLKDYKEFTDRISTIFTCLFDSVDGDQKAKVVNLSRLESGEVLASLEITSQYNSDERIIQSALEVPVNSGNVDTSLETIPDGFTFAKQGDTYRMEIKLTKVNAAALAQKDTKEFRIMAKRLERILLLLFDTVPGTQSVEVEEFRYLTSDCATAICKLTSEKHKDDKSLEEAISIPTSEGRLGKTLKTICTHNGFSFKEVIVFEAEINVIEKYSKTLANSNSNEFKAFANRVQPILKGLYDSVTGEQDVEIVKCRQGPSDTVLVLFHLVSCGNNDEEGLRAVTENKMRTESLSLSYGITDDGFSFETNKCIFEATLKLAEKYSDSKGLANPKSEAFKSLKEKVQPEILSLYDSVCGSQEIEILRYKSSGPAHSIIFNLTSIGCSDESILKEPIETQIQTGLLGSSLKVSSTSGLTLQKLTERVFYQVALNVKRQFADELKSKHSTEFNDFSKFVQSVLNTQYEKVPGKQDVNVVKCQQGPSSTVSTDVILEIISEGCADEDKLRRPIKDLITFGKLELKLKTNATDFSFKTVRGSKPVSSECFDLSLLITLLRRDSNVKHPKKGYDVLPSKDDISDGAQIARIKHHRNELAHASDAKMDEHIFDDIWSNLKNAIKHLGKADEKFMTAVNDASSMKLDSSTEELLIKMVQHDKQILQLEDDVYKNIEKLTKQTEEQSANTQVEISKIKEDIGKKEEQILENKTNIQNLYTKLQRIDEKFRVQDEINVKQDENNRNMESGIENNRINIGKIGGNPLFSGIFSRVVRRKEIDEIKLPTPFVEIKEVTKGAVALRDNDIVILVGIKGSGKSTIGMAIIKQYCNENQNYDIIQLSTTTNSDINYCHGLVFFHPQRKNVVVFLDDLFGRIPLKYAFKEHLMLLKWVHKRRDDFGLKILCTVQAETKACVEELFASDHRDALLSLATIINLNSASYPRRDMLIKNGFGEERSDNIIRLLRETGVQERIGFPALVSILKENEKLDDELFINPGNVFMKYLSSLKEGSAFDKMYFVILIHVLMTGKVFEENQFSKTLNISDKESMCHIAKHLFGNTLEFQNNVSTVESIIDEKEDGILMNINDSLNPYYCFKDEITPDFIFQYYKEEEFKKVLTTCSLSCIVNYFRPLTDTPDEPFVYIDSSLYQMVASHIISTIQKDLKTSRFFDAISSVKTLCMSPLLQDENFLMKLLMACDQLSSSVFSQPDNFRLGYDKTGSLNAFHFPSLLLHQSCRQLSLIKEENVNVIKMIFQKVCNSREEKVEICQTINKLVMFSMEELCKENIDDKEVHVLELLWNFIMDKEVDCQFNQFLMNAWRNQCSQTVIWLQENVKTLNCLQMDQCFLYIFEFLGEHKANWFLEQIPKSKQNKINMYNVFNQALERRRYSLMENIWKWENMILEDYRHDKQLNPNKNHADVKKNFANMFMNDVLKESIVRNEPFMWAFNTFKPHENYFDKTMIKKMNRNKKN